MRGKSMPYASFTGRSKAGPQEQDGQGEREPSRPALDGEQLQQLMRDLGLGGQPTVIDLPEE